ncbi:MAG: SIS domain-containing protein [Rickettsiales bacterium]|jgi:arabinose-5-phosphate isomerase|nr:SIS domain-containing protein [Rickettsiales bacterium]
MIAKQKINKKSLSDISKDKKKISLLSRSAGRTSSAKTVILQEAFSLQRLAEAFDTPMFSKAFIDSLHAIDKAIANKGKVIFSGMGKSSYVAHKIAATMASLGTPAIYVHAAESSHGDMGMICKNDVVFALSNSGESKEIFDLIDYCNKFKIPLIAMTRNADGKLAKKSDIVLLIPEVAEACPMGKAPTTSMIQMTALGDALCIVMSERIGMNPEKYRHFHPGGKLGASVIPVSEFFNPKHSMIVVKEKSKIETIVENLKSGKASTKSIIAVVDEKGFLSGTIQPVDLLTRISGGNYASVIAKDLMKQAFSVELKCPMFEASNLMNTNNLAYCFILKNKKPLGVLFLNDFSKVRN